MGVLDCGPGMCAAVLANALLPFYATKSEGMGLGPTLCREMIKTQVGRVVRPTAKAVGLQCAPCCPEAVLYRFATVERLKA